MNKFLLFLSFAFVTTASAQTDKKFFVGEWKNYLRDSATFEYLKLDEDGTGMKCFGKTLNGKDSLYLKHITTLFITKWSVRKDKLIVETRSALDFKPNKEYKVENTADGGINLSGEHLRIGIYPSAINREENYRKIGFKRAEKFVGYGIDVLPCLNRYKLFSFTPIDQNKHLASYIGFEDLVPHVLGCYAEYEYARHYADRPYTIEFPVFLKKWSFGFGNMKFNYSFDTDTSDKSETSIGIYYDFDDGMKNHYFSQVRKGEEKGETVQVNGKDIYLGLNWQKKFEGKIFLDNHIVIAYYTRNDKLQPLLRECITSFRYR